MALYFPTTLPAAVAHAIVDEERSRPQVYLNVGVTIPIMNPETGEEESTFVSLPLGLGLDTMPETETKGSSQKWRRMVQTKNWLLKQLQEMSEGVVPGATEKIEGLEIEIRRVGHLQEPAADENPLLLAMQGRLTIVR